MREPDSIDAYLATLTRQEREEIEVAGVALDLATMPYRASASRGLAQAAAAERAGLAQQAVSRLERSDGNVRLSSLRRYWDALGYDMELTLRDVETHVVIVSLRFPQPSDREPTEASVPGILRSAGEHIGHRKDLGRGAGAIEASRRRGDVRLRAHTVRRYVAGASPPSFGPAAATAWTLPARAASTSPRCSSDQAQIADRGTVRVQPRGVRAYSTWGGTTGWTVRVTRPSRSRSRSVSVRTF